MTKYFEDDSKDQAIQVHIGEQEWSEYSLEKKIRLLYRLRHCDTALTNQLEKSLSLLVEKEQEEREIDYEATLKKAERS